MKLEFLRRRTALRASKGRASINKDFVYIPKDVKALKPGDNIDIGKDPKTGNWYIVKNTTGEFKISTANTICRKDVGAAMGFKSKVLMSVTEVKPNLFKLELNEEKQEPNTTRSTSSKPRYKAPVSNKRDRYRKNSDGNKNSRRKTERQINVNIN